MLNKTIIRHLFIGVLISVPMMANAATFMADANVASTDQLNDNLYIAGGNPVVSGDVNGDVFVAGGNVNVSGDVSGDVGAAGGSVSLTGDVRGDVRVFGGSLYIDSTIGGEVISFGGNVVYGPNARIGKDLIAGGDEIVIDADTIILGNKKIFQNMGEDRVEEVIEVGNKYLGWAYWLAILYGILTYLVVAAALMGLFPNVVKNYTKEAVKDSMTFWKNLGIGLMVLILVPIVVFILFISVIGALLGGLVMVCYVMYILLSLVTAGFIFGSLVQKWFDKGKELNWLWALGGVVVLSLVSNLPIIGWLIGLVFFLWSLGVTTTQDFTLFRGAYMKAPVAVAAASKAVKSTKKKK